MNQACCDELGCPSAATHYNALMDFFACEAHRGMAKSGWVEVRDVPFRAGSALAGSMEGSRYEH